MVRRVGNWLAGRGLAAMEGGIGWGRGDQPLGETRRELTGKRWDLGVLCWGWDGRYKVLVLSVRFDEGG